MFDKNTPPIPDNNSSNNSDQTQSFFAETPTSSSNETQVQTSDKTPGNMANPLDTHPPQNDPENFQESASNNPQNYQEVVVTAPHAPRKYGGKKIIATIFGILLLIGGVIAGVVLVRQKQELREKAGTQIPPPTPTPTLTPTPMVNKCICCYNPRLGCPCPQGCTDPLATGCPPGYKQCPPMSPCVCMPDTGCPLDFVCWDSSLPQGPDCVCPPQPTETPPPTITAQCLGVRAYDKNWNLLSLNDLSKLKPGDIVRFAVSGTGSEGTFDKARFTINGIQRPEVTTTTPFSDLEFYDEYTIPFSDPEARSITVFGEIHHSLLGWF